jgi:hypothetical protein
MTNLLKVHQYFFPFYNIVHFILPGRYFKPNQSLLQKILLELRKRKIGENSTSFSMKLQEGKSINVIVNIISFCQIV